ncbi:hypothetical protein DMENIID0001_139690 [Sergentomyia squamirostris]
MKLLLKVHRSESAANHRRRSGLNFNANHTHSPPVDTSSSPKYSTGTSGVTPMNTQQHPPIIKSEKLSHISIMFIVLVGCAFGLTYVVHRLLHEDDIPPR